MQDSYVGDIGDYGKYGLLRAVTAAGLSLGVNWYRVQPPPPKETETENSKKRRRPDDGKYTSYLEHPAEYRAYDPVLFDCLAKLVRENRRTIEAVKASGILKAQFYSKLLTGADRRAWHQEGLLATAGADVVFLDPDNGLETARMHARGTAKEKHTTWQEGKDYYDRGQSVILYQHRPQRMKREDCVRRILDVQNTFLRADHVLILEYPRYTNRYYAIFAQAAHRAALLQTYCTVTQTWKGLCRPVELCRLKSDP